MRSEYEIIENTNIKYLKIFIVNLSYRNPHIHNSFELCYILDGKVQVITKECNEIYNTGDIFLFNPGQAHELKAIDCYSVLILSVQISYKFCNSYFPPLQNIEFATPNIAPHITDTKALICSVLSISKDYFRKIPLYELLCMGQINLLFYQLLEYTPYIILTDDEKKAAVNRTNRLNRIIDDIENNFSSKLLLSEIAEKENLSLSYLSHFFKDNFNMTFQEYLNNLRLEKAIYLLAETNRNILDICLDSGFSDSRYFNNMLLKRFGCGIREFREKALKETSSKGKILKNSKQELYSDIDSLAILEKYLSYFFQQKKTNQ